MKKKSPYIIGAILLTLFSASCAITPRNTGSAFMFALPSASIQKQPLQKQAVQNDKTLTVILPQAPAELDTYRIAIRHDSRRWDYYGGARWSDFLPVVVRDNLTMTLAMSHIFKSVTTDESGLAGDRVLKTTLQAFQADYTSGSVTPVIHIHMAVTLVGSLEGTQIAAFTVAAERKASANTLSAIQAAFASAFGSVERKIATRLKQIAMKDNK